VVVESVEQVSEHRLVSGDVRRLGAVDALGAGLGQRQARPPVWTALVVLDAPSGERGGSSHLASVCSALALSEFLIE